MTTGQSRLWEREEIVASIVAVFHRAREGVGSALFVVGEAGLGKTAVVERASESAGREIEVATGRGEAMEASLPFGLAAELIGALPGDPPDLLAPWEPAVEPAAPYHRVLRWLRGRDRGPLALVVDDLHWADADSLALLGFLARRLDALPVALIAALRPWPVDAVHLARELEGSGQAAVLSLAPLTRRSADSMLAAVTRGRVSGSAKERSWELARGNPLLVEQVAAALDRGETLPSEPKDAPGVAEGLLLTRFAGLDPDGLACARAASVLGATFRPVIAAEAAGLGGERADRALEAMARTGLVEATDGTMLRFSHPLLAQALYDDISSPGRRRVHARCFEILTARGLGAEASEHAVRADLVGDDRAVAVLEQAGLAALTAGAVAGAVRRLEAAVRFSGDRAEPDLLLAYAEALGSAGRMDEAIEIYRQVLAAPRLRWSYRVEAQRMLGRALYLTGAADHGEAAFADAVGTAAANEPARAVQPLLDQSLASWLAAGPALALPLAERARDLARDADAELRQRAEATWGHMAFQSGDPRGLDATEPLARRLEGPDPDLDPADLTWPWAPAYQYAMNANYAERFEASQRAFEAIRDALERVGAANAMATASIHVANVAIRRGLLDDARRQASRATEFGEFIPGVLPFAALAHAEALLWLGQVDESEERCQEAERGAGDQWFVQVWVAHVRGLRLLWQGDEAASETLAEAEEITRSVGMHNPCYLHWGAHAVEAHLGAGRTDDAVRVVEWLEERAAPLPTRWPRFAAAIGRARLAEAGGDGDSAADGFAAALDHLDGVELPLQRVEGLLAYGGFLRRAGTPADARPHLAEALNLAETSGAGWLATTARSELSLAGGRRRRFAADRDRLTPAERRVADEAAAGHANAEIARLLHLSVNTVETHLKRVYSKLGIRSRRQLMQLDLDALDREQAGTPR